MRGLRVIDVDHDVVKIVDLHRQIFAAWDNEALPLAAGRTQSETAPQTDPSEARNRRSCSPGRVVVLGVGCCGRDVVSPTADG